MTTQAIEETPTRSSREIEQDIRDRRDKMDQTLDQLGNRLNLRSIVNTALEWWDEPPTGTQASVATRRACKGLARQIKQHPMPSLLIGGGLAWLIADSSDDEVLAPGGFPESANAEPDFTARHTATETLGDAKEAVSGAIGTAKNKLHEYADSAGEMSHRALDHGKSAVRKLGHEVAHGFEAGSKSFTRAVDGYPLGVGLAFGALGALLGLALPHTRKEDELMGEKSDELIETAKEKGEELLETGREIGGRVLDTVKDEAREQGFTGQGLAETIGEVAEKGAKVAEKARSEVVQAVQDGSGAKAHPAGHAS